MRSTASLARLALIAFASCAVAGGTLAQAQSAPGASIPPGWVWQGVWQDGRWTGQWVPGPGLPPGAPMPGAWQQPPAPYPAGPDAPRMGEHCRPGPDADADHDHRGWRRHKHDCEAIAEAPPPPAPAYPGYGPMAYPPMAYAPMGYMMVPVMTAPQAPCVETRTVTTEYIIDRRRRIYHPEPHHHDKRVYTGS